MTTFAASIDQTLERELPAAASGCQHAYGRIVLACQATVTAIALASPATARPARTSPRKPSSRAGSSSPAAQLDQLPALAAADHPQPGPRLAACPAWPMTGEAAEVAMGMAADPAQVADRLQRVEEEIAAEDIISALPADSREVLLLYYREGQFAAGGRPARAQRRSRAQAPVARAPGPRRPAAALR
jgi:hypothetical protein